MLPSLTAYHSGPLNITFGKKCMYIDTQLICIWLVDYTYIQMRWVRDEDIQLSLHAW